MADVVFRHGTVWTGVSGGPRAEAVAVLGDRILRVDDEKTIASLTGPRTRVVDLRGGLLLPGFIDAHTHFLAGGLALRSVRLRDARTPEEFAARIAAKARELGPGAWVVDGEWDHEMFDPPELPRRDWIDALTPVNPVCVSRLDGHMVLANGAALRAAGITKHTHVPLGGEIVRDPQTGEPTGILKDTAADLVFRVVPAPSAADRRTAAELALRQAAERGVTSVHEMADAGSLEVYQELLRENRLTSRLAVYIPITEVDAVARLRLRSPFGGPWLKLAGLKGFVDGSLGSATAFFYEPYDDAPSTAGLLHGQMFPEGIMERRVLDADRAGLQVAIHAIGDRANALLLDIYEKAERANGRRDRRFRIEHAQHLSPEDIARFGRLGVVASIQPYHLADDGRWAERKIGARRARTTYAFRSLLAGGAVLAGGSDWTVAPLDPILGIHAAVTRATLDGRRPEGWVPEEKLSVEEAVRAYTFGGAYAEFAEAEKGTLEEGKLADLVVLDRDLFRIPAAGIGEARVLMTMCGGRVVFERDAEVDPVRR
jgi:predicted amidohydrolase YtcJ